MSLCILITGSFLLIGVLQWFLLACPQSYGILVMSFILHLTWTIILEGQIFDARMHGKLMGSWECLLFPSAICRLLHGCDLIEDGVRNRNLRSDKQKSLQKQPDMTNVMDEDEALKQAIALSLKNTGETSDLQHAGLSQSDNHSPVVNTRKKKRPQFKSRVQMTEDDLVINFCQFDEAGKGSITLRDLQKMAASHDFSWTDKELADMIRCFDSDRDGKLTLDDFRNIILRCNMLQVPENP
ncbi:uncharacterized protein [Spinacia oleracea]|uniref:Uncharacterized protein isoform X4 n=1 Tax=Spinacia oleracea TaxID=3562 RepID=A0ABM3RD05_SPIOL|nr:uncharacterized protein LOC110803129 isoform X4 [Spinacia oleracea]